MLNQPISIRTAYKEGWATLLSNKKVLLIIYGMNLLLAFVAMGPMSNLLGSVFGHNLLGAQLAEGFDYTIITEAIRHSDVGFSLSMNVLASFLILFIPWSVFYQGGMLALARQYPSDYRLLEFWRGGAYYFFRFLRLAVYAIVMMAVVSYLAYLIMKEGGFNPLNWESESGFIIKSRVLIILLLITYFSIATFRDIAKVSAAKNDPEFMLANNVAAFTAIGKSKILGLSFLNVVIALAAALLYAFLRKIVGGALLPALFLGQMYLIFRMMCTFVRLASFDHFFRDRIV